jgi:hypothetical protein
MFIFLKAFSDPFVTAVEATSQSSPGTRAKLHKVEAVEEGLLLGEIAEYAAPKHIVQLQYPRRILHFHHRQPEQCSNFLQKSSSLR